jgi:uncharacterized protein YwqG
MARPDQHRNADCTPLVRDPSLARIADELAAVARASIRLLATPLDDDPPIGRSKLGGRPDLPAGTPWPTCRIEMPAPSDAFLKARPDERRLPPGGIVHLSFVGQIDLEEVRPFDTESRLPPAGLLSFFYNPQVFASDTGSGRQGIRDGITGFSYNLYGWEGADIWQVVYSESTEALERREFPETLHERVKYKPNAIAFRTEQTIPSGETILLPRPGSDPGLINLTKDEWEAYCELNSDLRANIEIHQMLGFADQWATTTDEGSYWHVRPERFPESPEWDALSLDERIATARGIRLLLQIGIFDYAADWWGRDGKLYFFIRDADLAKRGFSLAWGAVE